MRPRRCTGCRSARRLRRSGNRTSRTSRTARAAAAALGALATLGAGAPPAAQAQTAAVREHARGTVVAVSVRLPTGSAADPVGREGTSWLLAHALADLADTVLDTTRVALSVEVTRGTTVFTLLAVPEAWADAVGALLDIIFRAVPPDAVVERRRARLLGELSFERGAPVRAFEAEVARILVPAGDAWSRPIRGDSGSVAAVSAADLTAYRADHYHMSEAAIGVVGPARRDVVAAVLPAPPLADQAEAPSRAPGPTPDLPAWITGDRYRLVRQVTATWMAVAYPVRPSTSRTDLEFLMHLVRDDLSPSPPDPDVYGVDVHIEDTPQGAVLVIDAVVFPEAAARVEARILDVVHRLGVGELDDPLFRWRRRRFRTERLLAEAAPEAQARRITADLLRAGAPRRLGVDIWALDPPGLKAAAAGLGAPRILIFGPDLGQAGGRSGAGSGRKG